MVLIRRFEERAGQLYGLGLIGGFCHLYIGQEAVAVGIQSALNEGHDSVITGYRDHGHMLAYGIDPKVMAELTGREAGISRGKGGSMHMFSTSHKFYGGHGIVGAQVSLGAGLAFSTSTTKTAACALPISATARPTRARSTSFNMAALWKLPIIFVVENNQYAMGTAVKRSSAETHFHRRGAAFTIPGMDERHGRSGSARGGQSGGGICARGQWPGADGTQHLSLSRPFHVGPGQVSQPRGSAGCARASRPIEHAKKNLLERGIPEEKLKDIEKRIRAIVTEAADFAENSPEPEMADLIPTFWWRATEMAIELKMPALSPTMEEGKLARWLVKEGDEVRSGDILAEIETDKATMEFEAVDEGTIGRS
jgi:pyruvate dehydrogenase E1 component alpha subunit